MHLESNSAADRLRFGSRRRLVAAVVPALFLLACISPDPTPTALNSPAPAGRSGLMLYPPADGRSRDSFVARSPHAMVVAAHPAATAAGLAMLKAGGNAFDAFAAASFAISVVRPQSTGIGGGGFAVAYLAGERRVIASDFRERAPLKSHEQMFIDTSGRTRQLTLADGSSSPASVSGPLAVGVPGLVRGVLELHERFGRLSRAQVLSPAITLARDGFVVYPALAKAIRDRRQVLALYPASAAIFLPKGQPLVAGDKMVQGDLAATLQAIADGGAEVFYRGAVARAIVGDLARLGGIVSMDDLRTYTVKDRTPIRGTFRGHTIVTMPPPSSGGVHVLEMLKMLAAGDDPLPAGFSPSALHLTAEIMRRAYADRAQFLGDPDFVKVPVATLLSPAHALAWRRTIDPNRATPSLSLKPEALVPHESPSTTHISIVDPGGNAISTTQTINYTFGSGVVAAGTGVMLNDEMDDFASQPGAANVFGLIGSRANAIAPQKTMLSSMSPTLVFAPTGQLELVLGSPGGGRIITATWQTIVNYLDRHLPLADAVHALRIHHQWLPDELQMEHLSELPAAWKGALTARGHQLADKGPIGDVEAIAIEGKELIGVSDTRSDGRPMGL